MDPDVKHALREIKYYNVEDSIDRIILYHLIHFVANIQLVVAYYQRDQIQIVEIAESLVMLDE